MDDLDATSPTGETGKHSFAKRPAGEPFAPSPLARVDAHLHALRERIDTLSIEHALMRRLLHEAYAAGVLSIDPEQVGFCGDINCLYVDVDHSEATILRALLAIEEPDAD
jgi:hypothetical protein